MGSIFDKSSVAAAWRLLTLPLVIDAKFGKGTMELVLDNVGTWNVIKLGTHQHGQLCKHQLGTHKRKLWVGETREAITISCIESYLRVSWVGL